MNGILRSCPALSSDYTASLHASHLQGDGPGAHDLLDRPVIQPPGRRKTRVCQAGFFGDLESSTATVPAGAVSADSVPAGRYYSKGVWYDEPPYAAAYAAVAALPRATPAPAPDRYYSKGVWYDSPPAGAASAAAAPAPAASAPAAATPAPAPLATGKYYSKGVWSDTPPAAAVPAAPPPALQRYYSRGVWYDEPPAAAASAKTAAAAASPSATPVSVLGFFGDLRVPDETWAGAYTRPLFSST